MHHPDLATDGGKIHRAVLEFIRLTESHTGKYLAKVFADCLERFGLARLSETEIKRIKELPVGRWEESYKVFSSTALAAAAAQVICTSAGAGLDKIHAYFNKPAMTSTVLKTLGGSINYWHNQETFTPSLSQMGSDFCSEPASVPFPFVAGSWGLCNTIPLIKKFRSSMAVDSWDRAPFFPNLEAAIKILQQAMERGGGSTVED
ncbi:hypothetical protein DFH09DRAFT_1093172 [Mycena vulgaris]|nr:hypothetical protein DFH09DRAFT_1093172 [Mycena vulgaris]